MIDEPLVTGRRKQQAADQWDMQVDIDDARGAARVARSFDGLRPFFRAEAEIDPPHRHADDQNAQKS